MEQDMLNEGIVTNTSRSLVKSEMIRQLQKQGHTTPDLLERAVFEALTGGRREDIDWGLEDNKAGYFLWTRTFDELITELEEDGYLEITGEGNEHEIVSTQVDPPLDISQLVYPNPSGA
jgi:hypothetical protein